MYRAVFEAAERGVGAGQTGEPLLRLVHRTRKDVSRAFDHQRFNVAIARLMTLTNELVHALDGGAAGAPVREAAVTLVKMVAPFAPHIAEELWHKALGNADSVFRGGWPEWDEDLARREEVLLVVQVDGKIRDRITVSADASEETCRALASSRSACGPRSAAGSSHASWRVPEARQPGHRRLTAGTFSRRV